MTYRVYPGGTVDVTTFAPMTEELRQRFSLHEAVIVADRCMFSAKKIADLTSLGQRTS